MTLLSTLRDRRSGAGDNVAAPNPSDAHLDLLAEFSSELERLSATQRELLQELHSDGVIDLQADELSGLRRENAELRARVAEWERRGAIPTDGDGWSERQTEYEKLLEDKSEIIRGLHQQLQTLPGGPAAAASRAEVHDESVAQLRRELEQQRGQLEEDEAALMQQMRTMEMSLAKDRAELARLRAQLQRQQADFAREVEIASRNPHLRERLATLQRHQQENVAQKAGATPTAAPTPTTNLTPTRSRGAGLIRRLFS